MNAAKSSRNRIGSGSKQRRLGSKSQLDNSFTSLAMARTHSFEGVEGGSRPSKKLETCHEWTDEAPTTKKQFRSSKEGRPRKQKTIGDMFVEDDFEAISFGGDDFTTTSATTATTKSSAAKIVPVKVETIVDMDPFANIDNGFSDWNYGGSKPQSRQSPVKGKERRSRRRSSMSNVPMSMENTFEAPKEEPKELRRRARRTSLDMTLSAGSPPSRRPGDTSVSSGVSAKSNGSRSCNSNPDNKIRSRREGGRDGKGRSDRKQRQSRRRASMGLKIESCTDSYPQEEVVDSYPQEEVVTEPQGPIARKGTARRASLNMVAGTNSSFNKNSSRRARRATMNMPGAEESFQGDFAPKEAKAQDEWDESGFKVIK